MDVESNVPVKVEADDEDLPSTLKFASRALSDGSRDETPTPTYKHSWTLEQRLTLAMLAESYSNNWNEKTSVFNHFHRSDLRRCGGLRRPVINTQYNDMRKKGFNAGNGFKKLQSTLSPYDRAKMVSRAGLEKKAHEIGILLHAKEASDSSLMSDKDNAQGHKRKRTDSIDDARTDFFPHLSDNDCQTASYAKTVHGLTLLPKTPTKSNGRQKGNGLLTPPDSREAKMPRLTTEKRLAQIGFRAFTGQSQGTYSSVLGIRAGAFLNCPTIPLARNLEVTLYRGEALHHITKHDHSRPSKFVSATKNPMRALHMALRGGEDASIAVIDLTKADERGNVEKAHSLKLKTDFRYTGAGEYLIFGGVDNEAIISHIPLSRLLVNMPTTPGSDDPFFLKVLHAHERLSHARRAIRKEVLPMTFSLGRAVGELVGNLCIPPKYFKSGVWSITQDYKFYNAEGGRKRGQWDQNAAFKNGAVQGYYAVQPGTLRALTSLDIENNISSAREIIEIDESASDQTTDSESSSSDKDDPIPTEVEDWVRDTQAKQTPLQYFDLETNKWTTQEEDLSDDFFAELRDIAGNVVNNGSEIDDDNLVENVAGISRSEHQHRDMAGDPGFGRLEMDTNAVNEKSMAVPATDYPEEFKNLNDLVADVMHMHGDEAIRGHNKVIDYEFSWTGM